MQAKALSFQWLIFKGGGEQLHRKSRTISDETIGAIQLDFPSFQPLQQTPQGAFVTIATFPVNQLACITTISFPDPEFVGFFLDSATSRQVRRQQHRVPAVPAWWHGTRRTSEPTSGRLLAKARTIVRLRSSTVSGYTTKQPKLSGLPGGHDVACSQNHNGSPCSNSVAHHGWFRFL